MSAIAILGSVGAGAHIIINILRWIFFLIDAIVYSFASIAYEISISLYSLEEIIPADGVVDNVSKVIYSFLAIAMFFKLAFSLLGMLVDPSKINSTGKNAGASKLIMNVFICLFLIAIVPFAFGKAKEIQSRIINDHLIEKAVYGENYYNQELIGVSNVLGNRLALATWGVFLKPSRNTIFDDVMEGEAIDGFRLKISSSGDSAAEAAWKKVFSQSDATRTMTWRLAPLFLVLNERTLYVVGNYDLSYIFLISTVAGIYLLWVFIKQAIDIAYRSVKLIALEILSPIAIISYLDPKSSTSGLFAKWLKETWKTYLSLFIKIFVFALASILLMEFNENWENASITGQGLIVLLAIIAFIKNAPAFIDKLFGTELSKGSETKFVTDLVRQGLGGTSNAIVGGISSAVVAKRNGLPIGAATLKGIKSGWKSGATAAKKGSVMDYGKGVYSSILGDDTRGFYGLPTKAERDKASEKDRRIRAMLPNVRSGETAKSTEVARLNDNNGREIDTFMSGEIISKNGYTYGMMNGFTKGDAVAKGSVVKYHSTITTNAHKGYSSRGQAIYNKEARATLDAEIAKRTYDNAHAYYSLQMSKSTVDKESELIRQYGSVAAATSSLGVTTADEAFEKSVEVTIAAQTGGRTLTELENVSNKAQSDATQSKTAREEYEASNAGTEDKIKRESYEAAKRALESGRY